MLSRGRMPRVVPYFGIAEFIICLWIACALFTLAESQRNFYFSSRYGKREVPETESFIIPFRYGRSDISQKFIRSSEKSGKAPRADQFFTSRLGKRSRFSAILEYMDRANRIDDDRSGEPRTNADVLGIFS